MVTAARRNLPSSPPLRVDDRRLPGERLIVTFDIGAAAATRHLHVIFEGIKYNLFYLPCAQSSDIILFVCL